MGSGGVPQKFHVAVVSPRSAPRILHQPIVKTVLGAVPHQKDTMTKVVAALLSENTGAIELERHSVGSDGHRDGPLLQSCHQGLLRPARDIVESPEVLSGNHRLAHSRPALAVDGLIGIVRLRAQPVPRDVGEGVVHQPPPAPGVPILPGTVNQMLFRELQELSGARAVHTLKSAYSREGPAGPALSTPWALVHHRVHALLLPPVDGGRKGVPSVRGQVVRGVHAPCACHGLEASEPEVKLFGGHVCELIDLELHVGVCLVVGSDPLKVLLKDLEPLLCLCLVCVPLVELVLEGVEGVQLHRGHGGRPELHSLQRGGGGECPIEAGHVKVPE
mmetsp:Transcript_10625/g.20602  ORF Transcript_10625/g.20602 Transcript_10625/m.20602 type:complete len:332 (+) Transcript_10625:1279-2274(+)